jgi:soluble lytic murein transglycosylase-like protein
MALIIAQIQVESQFRADVISSTNDYGLMQINKINHKWLSERYGITDFLNPYQNVICGVKMMSEHYSCYGDLDKALMAYNLGVGGASKLWNQGIYSTEYVEKIKTAMAMLQTKESV